MSSGLTCGPKAIALLHAFEGCKLRAYKCPAGVWTIGWGDTGPHVKPGLVWSQRQANDAFTMRLANEFEPAVRAAIGNAPTEGREFGAMVALAYNIGCAAFRRSSVLRRHVAGDRAGAAKAFAAWCKAGGRILPGLVRRRAAEAALYAGDFDELKRQTGGKA